jgi:hypothetical protein
MSSAGGTSSSQHGRKAAKLALDEVLKRYRIQHPDEERAPRSCHLALVPGRLRPANYGSASPESDTRRDKTLLPLNRTAPLNPQPLDLDRHAPSDDAEGAEQPCGERIPIHELIASRSPNWAGTRHGVFHYLIQIAECSVTLLCQVTAESAMNAKEQVMRLPNLIEFREISFGELAQIMRLQAP